VVVRDSGVDGLLEEDAQDGHGCGDYGHGSLCYGPDDGVVCFVWCC
jgi:hypothetical protein